MKGSKVSKLVLDDYGSHLGMEKGCFTVKNKEGTVIRYPLFENEIGEVILKSGNTVSTGALASLGFWDIDVLVLTQRGRPVAMLRSLDDDSHVKTRLCQYEAFKNDKGIQIAKQFVLSKIEGQNQTLKKYGLEQYDIEKARRMIESITSDGLESIRNKLTCIEGRFTEHYFGQVFSLISEKLRPASRKKYKAYDGINNAFNLAYEVLSWKVHRALLKAKLEPFLGFLHSVQFGKPSLICDFIELYRYLIDDFLIQFCQNLRIKDFIIKTENQSRTKKGKREYLNETKTRDLIKSLDGFFETTIEIPRIKVGKKQTLETLINEEALLLAKFLRDEKESWNPRIVNLILN